MIDIVAVSVLMYKGKREGGEREERKGRDQLDSSVFLLPVGVARV